MSSLVSICVPVYNTEKYLTRCVDSLLSQTYQNLEIILVDDGSTDNCGMLCDRYAKLDSRVKVIHKRNGGEASARNAGLHAAKGDYIMFIDSDDEYLPDAVQLMANAAKSDEADLVIGGYIERRAEIEHFATGHLRKYSAKEAARSYLYADCNYGIAYIISSINAKLFRHEIINTNSMSFDERFVIGNDVVFICEYLKHTRSVYDVFAPIYIYYKFHPSERVQGMGWYYPDTFFLFAYMADKMIKIAQLDGNEYKQLIIKHYKDLIYGLVNATANKEHFKNGLMPYLTSFCSEIDLLQIGARLDLAEDYIKNEEGALPYRLISYFVVNKRFDELYEMLQAISKARNLNPFKGEHIRQMIQVESSNNLKQGQGESRSDISNSLNSNIISGHFSFTDDKLLVEQVNELVKTLSATQRQVDSYVSNIRDFEARISDYEVKVKAYEGKVSDCEAIVKLYENEINNYIQSTSWQITKPFRTIMSLFKRK